MRIKERVPIILDLFKRNKEKVMSYLLKQIFKEEKDTKSLVYNIESKWEDIETIYKRYPVLRLTQVLVSARVIPNYYGLWYHIEDEDVMVESGVCDPRDIYFWGVNYDKNGDLLPKTEYKLIKDLQTEHIQNILKGNCTKNKKYIEVFKHKLKLR